MCERTVMFERADAKVIILIMLMAIILAVTAALAYFFLLNRPEYPEGTYTTNVEDQVVLVESDPRMAVRIVSTPAPVQEILPPVATLPVEGQGGTESGGTEGDPTAVPLEVTQIIVTPLPEALSPVLPTPTLPPPTAVPRPNQVIIENYQVT